MASSTSKGVRRANSYTNSNSNTNNLAPINCPVLQGEDMDNLKDLLYTSLQSVVALNDLVTTLTLRVADLTLSLAQAKADIQSRETEVNKLVAGLEEEIAVVKSAAREVMIVSGEEAGSEPACARVCAGTTGRGTTTWNDVTSNGVKLSVDISQCGFVKVPTVTTSVEGKNAQWRATGLAAVYSTTTESFVMWVEGLQHNPTGGNAESWVI